MKLVKELDWERLEESVKKRRASELKWGQEVWDESLYFNPEIYDYAKDNNLDLNALLLSLQEGDLSEEFISGDNDFESLAKDIFGSKIEDRYGDGAMGSGWPNKVVFAKLAKMDERTIKSPLNVADLGLWNWEFMGDGRGGPHLLYYPDGMDGSSWSMSPYIFGVAKNFTYTSPFFNYQTLPK